MQPQYYHKITRELSLSKPQAYRVKIEAKWLVLRTATLAIALYSKLVLEWEVVGCFLDRSPWKTQKFEVDFAVIQAISPVTICIGRELRTHELHLITNPFVIVMPQEISNIYLSLGKTSEILSPHPESLQHKNFLIS